MIVMLPIGCPVFRYHWGITLATVDGIFNWLSSVLIQCLLGARRRLSLVVRELSLSLMILRVLSLKILHILASATFVRGLRHLSMLELPTTPTKWFVFSHIPALNKCATIC